MTTASFPVDAEDVEAVRWASGLRKTQGNLDVVALDLGGDRSLAGDEVPAAEERRQRRRSS